MVDSTSKHHAKWNPLDYAHDDTWEGLPRGSIKVSPLASQAPSPLSSVIIIAGGVSLLRHFCSSEIKNIPNLAEHCPIMTSAQEELIRAAERLSPSPPPGGFDHCPAVISADQKVVLIALSEQASRNNCPCRPDQLFRALTSFSETPKITLLLLVEEEEDALPLTSAAARTFPLFSRKTGSGSVAEKRREVAVLMLPRGASSASKEASSRREQSQKSGEVLKEQHPSFPAGEWLSNEVHQRLQIITNAIQRCAYIVDAPCCTIGTRQLADIAKQVAEELNAVPSLGREVEVTEICGEELKLRGFGGMWAVGKAAATPPRLVALTCRQQKSSESGNDRNREKTGGIVMVGKGIVYDTGGLSLKGREGMCGMKQDCGGAAAVLCGFMAAVEAQILPPSVPLTAVLCVAENAIGPSAVRPDDIITMKSGKTVEVNNPDAEGRLVVADGVNWSLTEFQPKTIIDMCTLTGAQSATTGRLVGALLSNSEPLEKLIIAAGKRSGDVVFPVIYCPEFHLQEYSSRVADMKNSSKDRVNASVSVAGMFIDAHGSGVATASAKLNDANATGAQDAVVASPPATTYEAEWAHIDMCAPGMHAERATGFGVALFCQVLSQLGAGDAPLQKRSS